MALDNINPATLPTDIRPKLLPNEIVHHFAFIDSKGGGCASGSVAKQWILVTNQRIVFEASIKEQKQQAVSFTQQSGSIPMGKVSYVGTATISEAVGCATQKTESLRINSGGGEIVMALPTKQMAEAVQDVVNEILARDG